MRDLDLLDFPGCVAVSMTQEEVDDYQGRIEYREAGGLEAMVKPGRRRFVPGLEAATHRSVESAGDIRQALFGS